MDTNASAPLRNVAIGYTANLPVSDPGAFVERDLPVPEPAPGEVVVAVEAVSVNPVDVKQRAHADPGGFRVLGYDAAGTVVAVGGEGPAGPVGYQVGDEVWYAGSVARPGSDQRYQAVEARLVGRKPRTLGFAAAASLPLTALTAWEAVFDRLGVREDDEGDLLVVGATGGVGSVLLQLVRARAPRVRTIATASGDDAARWVRELGAAETVDHHAGDLEERVLALAPDGVRWVFTSHSAGQVETYARVVAPFGAVVAIDDGARDVAPLKERSVAWHWEFMFTDALHAPSSTRQRGILDALAGLVDAGAVRPTVTTTLGPLSAETLREAHRLVETGHVTGKVVVAGWPG